MQLPNTIPMTLLRIALSILGYVGVSSLGFIFISQFYSAKTVPNPLGIVLTNGTLFVLPVVIHMAALRHQFPLRQRPFALIGSSFLLAPISIITLLSFWYAITPRN